MKVFWSWLWGTLGWLALKFTEGFVRGAGYSFGFGAWTDLGIELAKGAYDMWFMRKPI